MLQIFKRFDQDGDGFIEKEELGKLLSKLDEEATSEELDGMMKIADENGDGVVSYEEFVKLITGSSNNCNKSPKKQRSSRKNSKSSSETDLNKIITNDDNILSNNNKVCSRSSNSLPKILRNSKFEESLTNNKHSSSSACNSASSSSISLSSLNSDKFQKKNRPKRFTTNSIMSLKNAFFKRNNNNSRLDLHMTM